MTPLVLDLCGGTGAWAQPYADAGYRVRRVDVLEGNDIRLFEKTIETVQGILCAPPCNHFSGSGARWWSKKGEDALLDALSIADACLRLVALYMPTWWALENPIGRLKRYYGEPRLKFDPCDFGDPYRKKTLVWGNFNKPVKTSVKPRGQSPIHHMANNGDRASMRSITPSGFAKAFFEANP